MEFLQNLLNLAEDEGVEVCQVKQVCLTQFLCATQTKLADLSFLECHRHENLAASLAVLYISEVNML